MYLLAKMSGTVNFRDTSRSSDSKTLDILTHTTKVSPSKTNPRVDNVIAINAPEMN